MHRPLHSSPPRIQDSHNDIDSSLDTSFDEDYQLRSEGSIVHSIISRRRKLRIHSQDPIAIKAGMKQDLERLAFQERQRQRNTKLAKQRGDMERFVLEREHQLSLQQLCKEAEEHALNDCTINQILDEIDPPQRGASCSPEASLNSQNCNATYNPAESADDDDDEELLRMLEQREEYEQWAAQEQQLLEHMMESFNI